MYNGSEEKTKFHYASEMEKFIHIWLFLFLASWKS